MYKNKWVKNLKQTGPHTSSDGEKSDLDPTLSLSPSYFLLPYRDYLSNILVCFGVKTSNSRQKQPSYNYLCKSIRFKQLKANFANLN